jgi:Papain family cysteine protease
MVHPTALDARQEYLDERRRWRESLPPSPVPDFLTGLDLRPPDPRDANLAEDPEIARLLAVGLPEAADLVPHFKGPVLNQGSIPSCVAHTMAHMQAIHQSIEEGGVARVFDAPRAHRETGPEEQGRWPDDLLRYCQGQGMPLTGAGSRYRITAYAFAPKGPQWADTIKAAIVAQRPVPICYLLPQNYGWESSGGMTQGYHETLIVGYRQDAFLMLNSWSSSWGKNGYGWVPIRFLEMENYQQGHVIAHSGVMDERLAPIPDPEPQPVVRISHYTPAQGRPGAGFRIHGEGFHGEIGARWGNHPLVALAASDREILATPPLTTPPGIQPVFVTALGVTAQGPPFTLAGEQPQPDPLPPPPGVTVEAKAAGGGLEFLKVGSVLQSSGGGFSGSLTLFRVTREQNDTDDGDGDTDDGDTGPDPTGELQIRHLLTGARGGWNLFVYVTDPLGTVGQAHVTISGSAGVTVRPVLRTASLDGRRPATASVKGPVGGQVEIEATAGSRSGRATAELRSAGSTDLPPLLEELE